ncbi:MAG: Hpt domain-containing protein [Pirellulaceae bacterium]|nr:Hpt domain-containing protein [Pirellulaceae bacterium]
MPPVFDHLGSLHRMGDDEQLFEDMAGFLRDDAPARLQEIRSGLMESNYPRVKYAAHTLKGLISNFGAARAVSAVNKLEHLLQQRKPAEDLDAAFADLQSAVDELQAALSPFCTRAPSSA